MYVYVCVSSTRAVQINSLCFHSLIRRNTVQSSPVHAAPRTETKHSYHISITARNRGEKVEQRLRRRWIDAPYIDRSRFIQTQIHISHSPTYCRSAFSPSLLHCTTLSTLPLFSSPPYISIPTVFLLPLPPLLSPRRLPSSLDISFSHPRNRSLNRFSTNQPTNRLVNKTTKTPKTCKRSLSPTYNPAAASAAFFTAICSAVCTTLSTIVRSSGDRLAVKLPYSAGCSCCSSVTR